MDMSAKVFCLHRRLVFLVFGALVVCLPLVTHQDGWGQTVAGCESEGGLAGRADILKCEPWESTTWHQGGWYRDQGDTGSALDGRRFYRYPVDAASVASTQIVTTGCLSGSCLKVNMNSWRNGGGAYMAQNWIIPGQGGCSHATLGCVPQQEIYMRYYMKLAPNFDPENYATSDGSPQGGGGKFPGLSDATNGYQNTPSEQCGNGGEGPTRGTECWSLRLTYQICGVGANGWRNPCAEGGNPNATTRFGWYPYLYWDGVNGGTRYSAIYWDGDGRGSMNGPCTSTYGFGGGPYGSTPACGYGVPGLVNDKWYLVEVHVKMNTPGQANGVMEAWLDGELRYQKTNVNFRNVGHNNLGVRAAWFNVLAGGSGVAMKEDTYVLFDQLVIATGARPGPWTAGSGVTPPPPPPVVITPPPPPPPTIPQPVTVITATNLGITGEDKVGKMNQNTPNGTADFHIAAGGLRATPTRVRITSNSGGIWETPFNGQNWIIATQYDGQGNAHFWFEPFASSIFRVQVWYSDGTTATADAGNAPAASGGQFRAINLGVTGEDRVGEINQTSGNGKADFHMSVSGLRGTPNKVTIVSDTGGVWETPFNGYNWIIATQYDGQGSGHFWFEQYPSNRFRVIARYADGSNDDVEASNTGGGVTGSAPLRASYLGITGEDKVGRVNQTAPNGAADFHVSVSGLRGQARRVTILSDTGGVWETPFNGYNWIVATQYDGQGNGHFWFEQYPSNRFRVIVYYADGSMDQADVL
ncbi:MAG: hypothetical protein FJ145_07640 [Deltaproteobacteria bacterium]|nr:hypothetical protein [Deltaproteobacteria bacterium]